jgi:hypothetical protein
LDWLGNDCVEMEWEEKKRGMEKEEEKLQIKGSVDGL